MTVSLTVQVNKLRIFFYGYILCTKIVPRIQGQKIRIKKSSELLRMKKLSRLKLLIFSSSSAFLPWLPLHCKTLILFLTAKKYSLNLKGDIKFYFLDYPGRFWIIYLVRGLNIGKLLKSSIFCVCSISTKRDHPEATKRYLGRREEERRVRLQTCQIVCRGSWMALKVR